MLYVNEGPNFSKGKGAYDIAVVDAVTGEKVALYIGYYNGRSKTLKLYPNQITDIGKKKNYKMEVRTIGTSQIKDFD